MPPTCSAMLLGIPGMRAATIPGGRRATFWGQVRPDAQRTIELQMRRGGGGFRTIRRVNTDAGGYWVVRMPAVRGASYRYVYRTAAGAVNSLTLPAPARA